MLWSFVPPKIAHDIAPYALKAYTFFSKAEPVACNSFSWRGLHFPNRLGIAGGVDKTASSIIPWWKLGAGFIEVGTVTPQPQKPNSGKILIRDEQQRALWNKMGFPSPGSETVLKNLKKIPSKRLSPIFINIGKNRQTESHNAHEDYSQLVHLFQNYADAFVINISSPNTEGLRSLQEPETIHKLISQCQKFNKKNIPVLIKFSPDLHREKLKENLLASLEANIDGWILTNTTTDRTNTPHLPKEGGVSGTPLTQLSRKKLEETIDILGTQKEGKLLISTGGIMGAEEADLRLDMGADLIQFYSALVFKGPRFFKDVTQFWIK